MQGRALNPFGDGTAALLASRFSAAPMPQAIAIITLVRIRSMSSSFQSRALQERQRVSRKPARRGLRQTATKVLRQMATPGGVRQTATKVLREMATPFRDGWA